MGDTLGSLAVRAHQKGLELTCRVEPAAPDWVVGDPGRLRQVLVNLVGNAIKFTDRGEIGVRVGELVRREQDVEVQFEVRDSGLGIPLDKQADIFEAFVQADGSSTRRYGGTGLGLTIAQRFVTLMGGRIWLRSVEGGGSTFYFTARFGLELQPAAAPGVDLGSLAGMRVLVVDDSASSRRALEQTLAAWGVVPTSVGLGTPALDALDGAAGTPGQFETILLDNAHASTDAFRFAARIREDDRFSSVPIVLLARESQLGDAAKCREFRIGAYLTRPVRRSDLLDALLAVRAGRHDGLVTRHSIREGRRQLRVLVAEDNAVNQRLAVRLLQKWGHHVAAASTGREVIDWLERERFDVVLMDVQMPEMNGFEATWAIRADEAASGRHVAIIAMTAHAMKGDRERCLQAGMDGYVAKPIDPDELWNLLQSLPGMSHDEEAERSGATPASVDASALVERVGGDLDLLADLVSLFGENSQALLDDLERALEARDCEAASRVAHSLKGSIGNFSTGPAYETVRAVEQAARAGSLDEAARGLTRLERDLRGLVRELEEFVVRTQTPPRS